jgi:hypothetical protein
MDSTTCRRTERLLPLPGSRDAIESTADTVKNDKLSTWEKISSDLAGRITPWEVPARLTSRPVREAGRTSV